MATVRQKREVLKIIDELTQKAVEVAKKYNLPYISLTSFNDHNGISAWTDFHLNSDNKHIEGKHKE